MLGWSLLRVALIYNACLSANSVTGWSAGRRIVLLIDAASLMLLMLMMELTSP